ncbi:hypothetical protein AB205_0119560, partial [Aquarana catesbeiana]
MAFLGEQPQEQWVTELDRLVQQEIELDNLYQALRWHAEEGYLGETTECSPDGYDFGGPGLLWESLTDLFMFGDEGEPDLEDLREYRESMLGLAGVSELKPDLDHLLRKEQHLEKAYRKLLEQVQQHARELAVENPEIAIPKPEVLTTGQSSANLCPEMIASSWFHGQEMVNLYPQTSVAETWDLIDFSAEEEQPDEPPAEELLSGPKFTVLCLAPTVASAFLREEVVGLSPTTLTGTSEDLVTEQRVQDLCPTLLTIPETGDLIDVSVEEEPPSEPPAEVLASRQRVQDVCPTPAAIVEAQVEEVAVYRELQIRIKGENAVNTSQLQLDLVSVDGASVPTCIPQGSWAVGPDPQQQDGVSPVPLSSLQRQKGLQGEGPVQASPQQQICSLREAEVG